MNCAPSGGPEGGETPPAACFAGVDGRRVIVKAMVFSGAIAGFAGAIQVLALDHQHYFRPDIASGYGFDALGVGALAGVSSFGLIPAALLFGALRQSSTPLQTLDNIPKGATTVILSLVIIIAAAVRYRNVRSSHE